MKSETDRQNCACRSPETTAIGRANDQAGACRGDCNCGVDCACLAESCSPACGCAG